MRFVEIRVCKIRVFALRVERSLLAAVLGANFSAIVLPRYTCWPTNLLSYVNCRTRSDAIRRQYSEASRIDSHLEMQNTQRLFRTYSLRYVEAESRLWGEWAWNR
jgi:hypothetical protein